MPLLRADKQFFDMRSDETTVYFWDMTGCQYRVTTNESNSSELVLYKDGEKPVTFRDLEGLGTYLLK
ncbi:hypothetical protein GO755_33310 [Spirosoma sp. HMF4905]|uniref:Uncharacterized protein n=1 Tax=Spirosoma arboris TaxID=2682092 RepID=A0A7K1SMD7_9BACT|nr:hypothetical protein [Spirosoma arboris]MVM34954.1 hypothetical protein [Spirosoma arboris]